METRPACDAAEERGGRRRRQPALTSRPPDRPPLAKLGPSRAQRRHFRIRAPVASASPLARGRAGVAFLPVSPATGPTHERAGEQKRASEIPSPEPAQFAFLPPPRAFQRQGHPPTCLLGSNTLACCAACSQASQRRDRSLRHGPGSVRHSGCPLAETGGAAQSGRGRGRCPEGVPV